MTSIDRILTDLSTKIKEQESGAPAPFSEYLTHLSDHPNVLLRNVFQRMYDMMGAYVSEGVDEYPDEPESVRYVHYDCSKLFVEGVDHPFFADRLFANRLVTHFSSFRRGAQQNRIYIFQGPHGSGKSTFLNNLLMKFEQYSATYEGSSYEIVWRLDRKALGMPTENESYAILSQLMGIGDDPSLRLKKPRLEGGPIFKNKEYLEVPCPSHDHPFLIIRREHRRAILDTLIKDEDFKKKLFSQKQYEWVFRDSPCSICLSLYQALLDILGSPEKVFEMVYARRYEFNRRLGQGISVFNPGDRGVKAHVQTNRLLQNQLNILLKDSNKVKYIYSPYANTNNGIYALMDVKAQNQERFASLHGIISEGLHKVEDVEENVNSLFLALMNPEDHENIEGAPSFTDRIIFIRIPYVLDYNTEVQIYRNTFGDQIERRFLPRVLDNFAKVMIASRLTEDSEACREWIEDPSQYTLYCDGRLHLLKMAIYAGHIPSWIKEEDRRRYTPKRRRAIIAESEFEGDKGFSGRDSIKIFNEFYSIYRKDDTLITMPLLCNYFRERHEDLGSLIPEGFLESLLNSYNYAVLQEVKECLYYFNQERVSKDIQNYICAVNYEPPRVEKCLYTGETVEISEEFFNNMERQLLGASANARQMRAFRTEIQRQYASTTLTQEILLEGRSITETSVYKFLLEDYSHNLREKVMEPFLGNPNFRRAIKDFDTDSFKAYDKRIRRDVTFLTKNLQKKYAYTAKGAKELCIYVIDNDLAARFA
jgi:predicted Ser/Thr protein kinase